jgi:outer membrane protein assembly factor BamB
LHCLDAGSGKVAWTFLTDHYINGAPAIYSSGAQTLTVFGGCDMLLHLVSVENGLELTSVEAGSYIAASVAVSGYQAFFGNYDGALLSVDLSRARVLWEYADEEVRAPFFSSPAVTEDRVAAGSRDGRLHCVDRSSGEGLWTFSTGGEIDSSPVICGDKVVFGSADGRIYLLGLADGKELWSYEIGAAVTSSPAVVGDRVIIGADDGLIYAFGP